jgi:hypothetical protein
MRGKYLTKQRLQELEGLLSERDKAILRSLEICRYCLTDQIRRLHFTDSVSKTAALRTANRIMTKLRDYGLAEPLERRIGGVRAGSHSYVWTLTGSGVNLLRLHDTNNAPRKRPYEPLLYFLMHTLAVSETYVRLTEICRANRLKLAKAELEPDCWRGYTDKDGKGATLKPDIFALIESVKYEDSYFIEVDMDSETVRVVLEKCKRYTEYYKSGLEQKKTGVFPFVVWLTPDHARKERLRLAIAECKELPHKRIFTVITSDELETLIVDGMEKLTEQKGEIA